MKKLALLLTDLRLTDLCPPMKRTNKPTLSNLSLYWLCDAETSLQGPSLRRCPYGKRSSF